MEEEDNESSREEVSDVDEIRSKLELLALLEEKSMGEIVQEALLAYYHIRREQDKGHVVGVLQKNPKNFGSYIFSRVEYSLRNRGRKDNNI